MKVLSKSGNWSLKMVCGTCKSVLEIFQADISKDINYGRGTVNYRIRCCVCDSYHALEKSQLPAEVMNACKD